MVWIWWRRIVCVLRVYKYLYIYIIILYDCSGLTSDELHRSWPVSGRRHTITRCITWLGHIETTTNRFAHDKAPIFFFIRWRRRMFQLTDHVLRRAVFPRGQTQQFLDCNIIKMIIIYYKLIKCREKKLITYNMMYTCIYTCLRIWWLFYS